jgi:hypothetical protein
MGEGDLDGDHRLLKEFTYRAQFARRPLQR